MPVSCSSLPHPHSSNQSVSMESLPRISMTDRSVKNQENPIQSKTPVRYEWILIRPGSRTCLAPRRLLHLIDLLHACIVMDTVPQFGAVFLARKRQLARMRSENRLCAVLAKPGEVASCGHWQNRILKAKRHGEHRGPRRMDVRALARMADVWPVLRLRIQDSTKSECRTKFWWQPLAWLLGGLKRQNRCQKEKKNSKKENRRAKSSPFRQRYVPIQFLRAKAGTTGPRPGPGQGQMEARVQDCRSKGKGSSYGERERGTSDQVPCLIAP